MGFRVGQKYRTNPLSSQSGGVILCVRQGNGQIYEYDHIQCPFAYIKKIILTKPWLKGACWWLKDTPKNVYKI